jgi:hypothetical protein
MQVISTKIFYISFLLSFKVWFIQYPSLFRVRFRQVSLYFIEETAALNALTKYNIWQPIVMSYITMGCQILYEGKKILGFVESCKTHLRGMMKNKECICRDCVKGSWSLSFLAIATFSFSILYLMISQASLHLSSKITYKHGNNIVQVWQFVKKMLQIIELVYNHLSHANYTQEWQKYGSQNKTRKFMKLMWSDVNSHHFI